MGNLFSKTPEKSQPQSPSAVPTSTIIELDSSLVSNTSKLNHVPLEAPPYYIDHQTPSARAE
jgi:hypothetical protein